jgi:8-oxo-dGTP diphosphatase
LRKETGITVTPDRLTGIYKNMERGIVALVFRCTIASGELSQTDEAREVAWLTAEEIKDRMDEAYAVRMLDALLPPPPAMRAHNGITLTD